MIVDEKATKTEPKSTMRIGYGSESHLLRMLGRHRDQFDAAVIAQLDMDAELSIEKIRWLEYPFNQAKVTKDGEWKSLDFLPDFGGALWKSYWPDRSPGRPTREGVPSWDAIGQLYTNKSVEWLLVEAKAHSAEHFSKGCSCGAKSAKSLKLIIDALQKTFNACGGKQEDWEGVKGVWLGRGYQLANRLACLHFLLDRGELTRLIYVYFIDNMYKQCPQSPEGWHRLISDAYTQLGLTANHPLKDHIHHVVVDIRALPKQSSFL